MVALGWLEQPVGEPSAPGLTDPCCSFKSSSPRQPCLRSPQAPARGLPIVEEQKRPARGIREQSEATLPRGSSLGTASWQLPVAV
jgi:hypothetical protein